MVDFFLLIGFLLNKELLIVLLMTKDFLNEMSKFWVV